MDAGGSNGLAGFRELRVLGSGGGGRVVAAVHVGSGRQVAIKYLAERLLRDERFREAFRAEALVMRDLSSPYVVAVYDYRESPTQAAIVMELVDGTSLQKLLTELGPTNPQAALAVLSGSLQGLAMAHERGVVHRDYKPGNVLVTRDGLSRLTDFGIAHRSGEAAGRSGTPSYMAPEQWRGAPADPATDVYAATAVFFECLTGRRPYPVDGLAALAMAHANAPIPADQVPQALQPLIMRGLAKDPAARPASAAQFRAELETAAMRGYGPGWEMAGTAALAATATALLTAALGTAAGAGAGVTVGSTASTTTAATGHSAAAGLASPASSSQGRAALLRSRSVRRLLRTTSGKATAAAAGTGVVAAATVVGVHLAAKPAANARPLRSASPAHTAPALAGPGTDCGPAGPVGAKQTYLIVTKGRVGCADAFGVLHRYQTGNDPRQGSGGFTTFNGWTCGHNSVAGIQSDGQVVGCQTSDNGIAFITQFSPTYSPQATPGN